MQADKLTEMQIHGSRVAMLCGRFGLDGRTDGRTDGQTDGRTDGRTDGCMDKSYGRIKIITE